MIHSKKAFLLGKASEYIRYHTQTFRLLPGQRGFLVRFVCFMIIIALRKYWGLFFEPKEFLVHGP